VLFLKKFIRLLGFIFVASLCALYFLPAVQSYVNIPEQIYLQPGVNRTIDLGLPVQADVLTTGVVSIAGDTLSPAAGMHSPLTIEPIENGDTTISLSLLGLPVKRVHVNVSDKIMLIPGGQSIGVTLFTKGALVVGVTGVELEGGGTVNPARAAGMIPGDVIIKINGVDVENADHVSKLINKAKDNVKMDIDRNGRLIKLNITPVADAGGVLRLGVWVRDSTAGVGTLTFIEPKKRWFGGLGHAICDLDTGSVLSVKKGEIYFSEIIQINKGESGIPGEIKGLFSSVTDTMGLIRKNTEFGIYGTLYDNVDISKLPAPVALAGRDDIRLGPASIRCTIDGEGVKEFSCDIVKITPQNTASQKGLVIQITDAELLEKTGGIVQGMSGSPILQNGRLVGAVTHVFINNPAKGYGLLAYWMIEQIQK